jgi:hypothetical protein
MDIKDVQDELFRLEYPYLHAGSDPDIERYCYLRSTGQGRDALTLYQFRLKPRYPDDVLRAALLHSYRSKDPLYPRLLTVAFRRLAERALERILRIIDYISEKIGTYNKQDVYSTVKTIEDILHILPREQYEAISGLDRMYRYAQVLNHRVDLMEQAAELVRSYLSRSLPILEHERNRRRQDRKPKRPESAGTSAIDFSTVVFSDADLARIEIPGRFSRVEDQTLAYCMKYWNLINDAAFEQILFLYSRKYGKKNHAVYLTIRRGRNADYRDEDILSSVMSLLVTGYYYSIQGDRYLQQNWQGIKNVMERNAPARRPPVKAAAAKSPAPAKPAAPVKPVARPAPPKPAAPAKPAVPVKPAVRPAPPKPAAPAKPTAPLKPVARPAPPKPTAPAKPAVPLKPAARSAPPKPAVPLKPAARPAPPKPAAPAKSAAPLKPAARSAPPKPAVPAKPVVPLKPAVRPAPPKPAVPAKSAVPLKPVARPAPPKPAAPRPVGGSVSDRLQKLSGRGYDLYQDRFLAHVRPAIRKVLGAGRGIFFTPPEKAEDLVYRYLRDHYADPYMNWPESEERRHLAEQGFDLPSLDPVIDECFRKME